MNPQIDQDTATPSALHIEVAILGAMILDEVAIHDATETLRVGDFSLESHRQIYRAILEMHEGGEYVDSLTLNNHLRERKRIESVGGPAYIAFLCEGIPRNFNIESYVRIVKEKALLCGQIQIYHNAIARAQDASEDPRGIMLDVEGQLAKAREDVTDEITLTDQCIQEMEAIRKERREEISVYIPSGVEEYDATHEGYRLNEVVVIGARPNIGKSTILRQGVMANCQKGNFVHLFSPEMGSGQIIRYMAAKLAEVPYRRLRHTKRLADEDLPEIEAAIRDIMSWPLKIDDSKPLTPEDLIARARSIKRKHNTKFLGIDYLQKIKYKGKVDHRHIEVTDMMVSLTNIAQNENMAVVVLSSLTEPSGKDRNRPPTKADLRQSGDIQFEADIVLLLHREIDSETHKPVPECSIIIDKARSDQGGVKKVYFNQDYIFFEERQAFLRGLGRA